MEDKKTIREMAEELGVSKTAIRKKMAVLFANDTGNQLSETVCGIIYISVFGQKLIVEAFSHNQRKPVSAAVSGKLPETGSQLSETGLQQVSSEVSSVELVIKVLQEQLSVKDSQLSVKDEQLAEKDRQIENLQTALAQEQAALAREQENVKLAQESVRLAQQLHGADKVQQALSAPSNGAVDGGVSPDGEAAAHDETVEEVAPDGTVETDGTDGTVGGADGKRHRGFRWPWSRRD